MEHSDNRWSYNRVSTEYSLFQVKQVEYGMHITDTCL